MTPRNFFDHVAEMRRWQKEYFRTRSTNALTHSKKEERGIDNEIERVYAIIGKKPAQMNLFN